ncbi:hypothetical protein Btru_003606 [Bulinus truncatus]|nr:hypothetical protein Btru_003606 [Bulinus truncatus]
MENSHIEQLQPFTEKDTNNDKPDKSVSVVQLLRTDLAYRKRVFQSLLLSLSSFTLGIVMGQQGPTFLDLQIITNTNIEEASAFFTSSSFGYMVGSFISGIVHGKVNNNLLMGIVCAGSGLAAITTPHCSPYYLMVAIRFTTNMFCGGIDTLVNAEHMSIWGSDGRSLLQLIHFTFALGGVLTPLFTEPFLAAKDIKNSSVEGESNVTIASFFSNMSYVKDNDTNSFIEFSNNTVLFPVYLNSTNNTFESLGNSTFISRQRTTNVHYGFLIAGSIAILTSVPYFIMIIFDKSKMQSGEQSIQKVHRRKLPLPLHVFVILSICFFFLVYCCVEDTFASFLMTFVVSEYEHVSKSKGAYITTYYWASFAAGRFLGIFVSKFIIAVRLIFIYTVMMVLAYTGFTICATYAEIDGLTAFSCMAGVAMSTVFPAGFSWAESELLHVTGWVSSFILIGSSIGMMINPLIIGYLMQEVSNMWFCYILLSQTLILCCLFAFLLLLNRCYINKIYGTVGEQRSFEIEVEDSNNELKPSLLDNDKLDKTNI